MKQMLIAGNWKMHKTLDDALELAIQIKNWVATNNLKVEVALCPPFTFIHPIAEQIKGSKIGLGAQNCYYLPEGAFTGEISAPMLVSIGCQYVIIGHSERRTHFNENNELINKKIISALNFGLKPIFCIGETLEERKEARTFDILEEQIKIGLKSVDKKLIHKLIIAYEPVWAIGTGVSAKTEQIEEAHKFIRKTLQELFPNTSDNILILYGGSLNRSNAKEILSIADVNGGLIGKASLDDREFIKIIEYAEQNI